MKRLGSRLLLGLILITLVFFVSESVSAGITMYGDTELHFNGGKTNVTFVDSGIDLTYIEYRTEDDFIYLDDIRLDVTTTNTVNLNISEMHPGPSATKGNTVLRFNATCAAGTVTISYVGNITRGTYDVYVDNVLTVDDSDKGAFAMSISSWSTKDIDIKFAGLAAAAPFAEVNWTNISGNWSDFILSGFRSVFGTWTYPLIFLGIIGYVYCINRSAMTAAAAICLVFGVYGITGVLSAPGTEGFSLLGWLIVIVSFSALFTTLFIRWRQ